MQLQFFCYFPQGFAGNVCVDGCNFMICCIDVMCLFSLIVNLGFVDTHAF